MDKDKERKLQEEFRQIYLKYNWEPDPTIQEFYDMCLNEAEFFYKGFHYWILLSENNKGFDVAYQDLQDLSIAYLEGWENQIPREHFGTRVELISKFRLRNDGRTILEYYCDFYKKPRILVPPAPTDYPRL